MAGIFFWIVVLLLAISGCTANAWKGGPYASTVLLVLAFILLGLKVFGFSL